MSAPGDTEPSPAPDAEMLDAIADDLETLALAAHGLGDNLDDLVKRLAKQADEMRGGR